MNFEKRRRNGGYLRKNGGNFAGMVVTLQEWRQF